jgi:parallel beta-helix repeat protein
MSRKIHSLVWISAALVILFAINGLAGSLEPTDPPGSTMKTLDQVQPCTPVQSLAGDATATHIIADSGSYYLTDNIIGESGKHGILVNASNVTIDLKGFSLIGVEGSLNGIFFIESSDPGHVNGAVYNGIIQNWGQHGINAEFLTTCRVTHITSTGNGADGIRLGDDGLAAHCLLRENGGVGVYGDNNCLIRDCVARGNSWGGFSLYSGGAIKDCVAESNGPQGILVKYESSVENCLSSFNGAGIVISNEGSSVHDNACVSNYNHGILCEGIRNRIDGNMIATRSSGRGITLDEGAAITIVIRNTVAVQEGAIAYDIHANSGASFGPIVDVTGVGDISSITHANHPWANFIY